MKRKDLPTVSFIIPTLNAAALLPKCLSAIRSQVYPQSKIEIIISDGGSRDETLKIAKKFDAKVIHNRYVLHEPGKTLASKKAKGDILFYTDSDNILSYSHWITDMIRPYLENNGIVGFLPQTIPAEDTNAIDRYFGYLFTDPFTWYSYYPSANPKHLDKTYTPIKITTHYSLYSFQVDNPPLFGLSQGVGTIHTFKRDSIGTADDMLAGIKLIQNNGLVAYVPSAGVYHYHIKSLTNLIDKYSWRVRNNLTREIEGMGITHRLVYLPIRRKIRMYLFIPYAFTLVFPAIDALRLTIEHKDPVMLLHIPMSFLMALIILKEYALFYLGSKKKVSQYV